MLRLLIGFQSVREKMPSALPETAKNLEHLGVTRYLLPVTGYPVTRYPLPESDNQETGNRKRATVNGQWSFP